MSAPKKSNNSAAAVAAHPTNAVARLIVCLVLAVVTLLVFWPVTHFDFLAIDDPDYVTGRPIVLGGFSNEGIRWAFSSLEAGFWQPLTWLSYMLDAQLFGAHAGGFHFTNLLLHTASAVLLFLFLNRTTRSLWPSAFVAALFALHPLRVEPVAWIASRKDVLSTLFWMLSLMAYGRYAKVRNPKSEIRSSSTATFYLLTLLFFACGLMSKTMVVTLPFILLLLDWWPLKRVSCSEFQVSGSAKKPESGNQKIGTLFLEKLPFFFASLICGILTVQAEQAGGALPDTGQFSLTTRLANAINSLGCYLLQTFWPTKLAVFYPYPKTFSAAVIIGIALLLLGISIAAFALRRRPWLFIGWFWFLITLAPVSGLIQVGTHARADRYLYLPLIGLFIVITWTASEIFQRWRWPKYLITAAAVFVLSACAFGTRAQLRHWQNSETLFRHALAVTKENGVMEYDLGVLLQENGELDEAIIHFRAAVRIIPAYADAWNNLGNALFRKGNPDEAIDCYRRALEIKPNAFETINNLGAVLFNLGRTEEAIQQFRRLVELKPDDARAWYLLGRTQAKQGHVDEARKSFETALQLNPDYAEPKQLLRGLGATMD